MLWHRCLKLVAATTTTWFLAAFVSPAMGQTPTLTVSPTSGTIGTEITITVTPATPGFELTPNATVTWTGRYVQPGGAQSPVFSVEFGPGDVNVTSPTTATIVLGQGAFQNVPDPFLFQDMGTLQGTVSVSVQGGCPADRVAPFGTLDAFDIVDFLSDAEANDPSTDIADPIGQIDFFDVVEYLRLFDQGCSQNTFTLNGTANIGIAADNAQWRSLIYPDGYGFFAFPQIGPEPDDLFLYRLSLFSNATNPTFDQLAAATGTHYLLQLRIDRNGRTQTEAPATIPVDVLTVNSANQIIDGLVGVQLQRDDTIIEPDSIVYRTSTFQPFIFIDTPIDFGAFPPLVPILAPLDGRVIVAPTTGP